MEKGLSCLVYSLGRGRVPNFPTPVHNPYPSYSGRVFESGGLGDGSGDGSININ
jgi:hypothetical protein